MERETMRTAAVRTFVLIGLAALSCAAQEWEIGGAAGYGFYKNVTVTSPAGQGKAGFKPGVAAGVVAGNNMYPRLSGEMRYTFRFNDLKVSGGGQQAAFSGESHAIHYDLLFHVKEQGARLRPFIAAGAGIKVYRGTGMEKSYQPANQFALLTKTREIRGLISLGAGVKYSLTDLVLLRLEFRDYLTPFPREVIAPSPGASIHGWVHDFVPMAGISFAF
jgi:opacity protein-like surface antigen